MKQILSDKDRLRQGCGGRAAMDGSFACLDLAIPVSCPVGHVRLVRKEVEKYN